MTSKELESRLATIEAELAQLKTKVGDLDASQPWWERIAGSFQDDPVYEKAMKLGAEYRRSQRPDASSNRK